MSAISEDGIVIADALPRRPDCSVIVGSDAQIYDTKYGELWVDTGGRRHPLKMGLYSKIVRNLNNYIVQYIKSV